MFTYSRLYGYVYLALWLGCSLLIGAALWMQYKMKLEPCALCITQRIFVIAIGITAFIAWLHQRNRPVGFCVYPLIGMVLAFIGGGFSSRHVWLQSLPEDLVPACGPGLGYLLEVVPFFEALQILLQGDGHCAESVWSYLGLTIPGWTLIAFIGLFSLNGWVLWLRVYKDVR